jgi:dolichol-phosphate mannosyltransferase
MKQFQVEPSMGASPRSAAELSSSLELSVVVPTFNEAGNLSELIERLDTVLAGVRWEAIVVDDDSPDGTWEIARNLAAQDPRIRCLRRVGRRGLAGAVIEGALASSAPLVAVIDADLQHDERLLPEMFAVLRRPNVDVVVGSRYLGQDTGVVAGLSPTRRWGSRFANWLGRRALSVELSDPVSGFFMLRRELIEQVAPKLSSTGFKVLFDILSSQPRPPRCVELPYHFRPRQHGESKLDHGVVVHYLTLVGSKLSRDLLSPRVILFAAVGASGVGVHLAVLRAGLPFGFVDAQIVAAMAAMTSNYLINNAVTYRERRKRGWALLNGYVRFCMLCSVGLAANVAVAAFVQAHTNVWWLSGIAGAAVGAGWNFVTTSFAVW